MFVKETAWKRIEERGPRYAVYGAIRPREARTEYADTAEQAEKIREQFEASGHHQVRVHPPVRTPATATINVVTGELTIDPAATVDGFLANGATLEPWGAEEYDMERADEALAGLGYRRVGDWVQDNLRDEVWTCPVGSVDLAALGRERADAKRAYDEKTAILRAGVLRALEDGRAEAEIARTAGIDRMTVRKWAGK